MKKILFFVLFSLFFISAQSQVVSYELIQTYSVADLQQVINNFGAGGILNPQYPVDFLPRFIPNRI
ncbi:MAG: hypothetical protein LRY27_00420 [Chitinophagales bacterium]|nr:hypothetical protein [Chitinophagales bacterium]